MNVTRRLALASFVGMALLWPAAATAADKPPRNVTFISTSDPHYREAERKAQNERDHLTILEINDIAKRTWPEKLGGDPIQPPRGVLMLGDCIDDGDRLINGKLVSAEQFEAFVADFGLDGTDGVLKFPVFETWGNHDGQGTHLDSLGERPPLLVGLGRPALRHAGPLPGRQAA